MLEKKNVVEIFVRDRRIVNFQVVTISQWILEELHFMLM